MQNDRRKHFRLNKVLPLKISHKDQDVVTQTRNISYCGAFCVTKKCIPLMTKLKITLLLPEQERNKASIKVDCCGVIVWSNKESDSAYNIGIFFNDIKDKEREKLSRYIECHLTKD